MSEAVELLGCPFCGGEALKCKGQFNNMRWVLCRACHASPGDYPTEAEAVAAWNRRANHGEVEPVAWPDREAVARALHARYEERARQRGQIGGDGYTVLGGARLEDCSRSLRQSFLEDADAILPLLSGGGE